MKKLIVTLSATAVLIFVFSAYFVGKDNIDIQPSIEKIQEVMSDEVTEEKTKDTYLIKKYGEKIGVFRKGAGKPFRIIDTFVFTLPQNDVSMLSHGFTVYENELVGIVEDYTS